ncbi:MAG: hypothetical protein RIQ99_131 [Pseudomonadota bacterium]
MHSGARNFRADGIQQISPDRRLRADANHQPNSVVINHPLHTQVSPLR